MAADEKARVAAFHLSPRERWEPHPKLHG